QKNHPWPPIGALVYNWREEPCESRFDDLVNAVSSGFVVTDILISMFLVMAIFEKLIEHLLSQIPLLVGYFGYGVLVRFSGVASKLGYQSPKASIGLAKRDITLPQHGKKEYEPNLGLSIIKKENGSANSIKENRESNTNK
ncbi:hypothetical protein IGI04_016105, partial [Brassica rapa subsp. trilocularis]